MHSFNSGYKHALAAFNLETGLVAGSASGQRGTSTSLTRAFLEEELDIVDMHQVFTRSGISLSSEPSVSRCCTCLGLQGQATQTPLLYALVGSATSARLARIGDDASAKGRLPGGRRSISRGVCP